MTNENEAMKTPNYQAMRPGDMLSAMGDDAQKWAEAFCQQWPDFDQATMIGWFANAIEHSSDVRFSRLVHDDAALANHIEELGCQRVFWSELRRQGEKPEA